MLHKLILENHTGIERFKVKKKETKPFLNQPQI